MISACIPAGIFATMFRARCVLCRRRHKFHKTANVLAALPKSAHPGAKKALAEIWGAEDKQHAPASVTAFKAQYGAKFPQGRREDHRRP